MKRIIALCTIASVLAPSFAHAQSYPGALIKGSGPAVYFFGSDWQRYVFTSDKVYFSWYEDFADVETISDDELSEIPIGGNVTYKPGVRLVKIQTDPKVYAVAGGGILRWVTSESIAAQLYGPSWASIVHDVPDAFFVDYEIGRPILSANDFDVVSPLYANADIDSLRTGGDISELPSDLPVYPNGTLQSIQRESSEDMEIYGYTMETYDSEEGIYLWFDTQMAANGWQREEASLLDLLFGGFLSAQTYTKPVGTDREAHAAVFVTSGGIVSVTVAIGPLLAEVPVPEIVPIYPNAVELIKAVTAEPPNVTFVGFSADAPLQVLQWYQGALASKSWVEVQNADEEANYARRYERMVGNQLMNIGVVISPIGEVDTSGELGQYQSVIGVVYGLADSEEFQNFGL